MKHINQRVPEEHFPQFMTVEEMLGDLVPAKRAGGVVLQPGANTISMKMVVASRQRPYPFSLRHLA